MHPADIKAALEKAGSSQRDIAHECGVTPSTVAHVINGRGVSARVAEAISKATGKSLATLWPARYGEKKAARPAAERGARRVAPRLINTHQ